MLLIRGAQDQLLISQVVLWFIHAICMFQCCPLCSSGRIMFHAYVSELNQVFCLWFPVHCTNHSNNLCYIVLLRDTECCILFETVSPVVWCYTITRNSAVESEEQSQIQVVQNFPTVLREQSQIYFQICTARFGFSDMIMQR